MTLTLRDSSLILNVFMRHYGVVDSMFSPAVLTARKATELLKCILR